MPPSRPLFARQKNIAAVILLVLVAAVPLSAQTFSVLFGFDITDGAQPNGTLVQGLDGNFYGTTPWGGSNLNCTGPLGAGCGTVFKITPTRKLTTLYSFCPVSNGTNQCPDGQNPMAGLVQGTDGNFYGVNSGGAAQYSGSAGTIFKITPQGSLTTLYTFCAQPNCIDGLGPAQALVQGTDGNFYGTTSAGGSNCEPMAGCGTAFRITPAGAYSTLYSFCSQPGCIDGQDPNGLMLASDGNFYGTTPFFLNSGFGVATIFRLTPAGTLTTLYTFCSQAPCPDGQAPLGTLVQGPNGNLYGTTSAGGAYNGGTVFEVTLDGSLTTLYSFCAKAKCADGTSPEGVLAVGTDGNFYGTTIGNPRGQGITIYSITPSGSLTTLRNLDTGRLDAFGLIQATNGMFYGTIYDDIPDYYGTIFRLNTGLGPFVETLPASGSAGTQVTILGTSLKGASSVSFNGTPAPFTLVSATQVTATVPAGATTGTVTVTIPNHPTLASNTPFQIP